MGALARFLGFILLKNRKKSWALFCHTYAWLTDKVHGLRLQRPKITDSTAIDLFLPQTATNENLFRPTLLVVAAARASLLKTVAFCDGADRCLAVVHHHVIGAVVTSARTQRVRLTVIL